MSKKVSVAQDREMVHGLKRKGYSLKEIAAISRLKPSQVNYLLYKKPLEQHVSTQRSSAQDVAIAAEAANEALIAIANETVVGEGSGREIETTIPLHFKIRVGVVS